MFCFFFTDYDMEGFFSSQPCAKSTQHTGLVSLVNCDKENVVPVTKSNSPIKMLGCV